MTPLSKGEDNVDQWRCWCFAEKGCTDRWHGLTAAASQARGEDLKLCNNKRGVRVLSFVSLGLRIIEHSPHRIALDRRLLSRF
jgi:hypothetical protein